MLSFSMRNSLSLITSLLDADASLDWCMIRALRAQVYTGFPDMKVSTLTALSPADGRYADKVSALRDIFSEYGLIRFRVLVEVRWLQMPRRRTGDRRGAGHCRSVMKDVLNHIVDDFSLDDAERVKKIEATTNHDVKAVEYFIRERLGDGPETAAAQGLSAFRLHLGGHQQSVLRADAADGTHGRAAAADARAARQAAQHGARICRRADAVAHARPDRQPDDARQGTRQRRRAAGTRAAAVSRQSRFAASSTARSAISTRTCSPTRTSTGRPSRHRFVESLGLDPNPYTTQIEPHDWTAEYAHALFRYNTILIDFARDLWGYISLGYFRQKVAAGEVGSSTMPHKVNPIDFENAEGNLGMANAMLGPLRRKTAGLALAARPDRLDGAAQFRRRAGLRADRTGSHCGKASANWSSTQRRYVTMWTPPGKCSPRPCRPSCAATVSRSPTKNSRR